jgi:hypothetical protein
MLNPELTSVRSGRVWAGMALVFCGVMMLGRASAQEATGLRVSSHFMDVVVSEEYPGLRELSIDSLGKEHFPPLELRAPPKPWRPVKVNVSEGRVEYREPGRGGAPRWVIGMGEKEIRLESNWPAEDPPEPIAVDIDPHACKATLLGLFDADGSVKLPALLHLPGRGTLRISCDGGGTVKLGYDATLEGKGFVRVTFPGATEKTRHISYRLEVTTVYPEVAGVENDARFDGFRRNWLNIFQLNPRRRVLSNNAGSDTCAFCYYLYADVARNTPALAGDLKALDMIRQTLEAILHGAKAYGMPGYGDFPEFSSDTYPSLLIAAADYVQGAGDGAWLGRNYPTIKSWADNMLATDRDGNGLLKYVLSGNSGSWPVKLKYRPANWWDTIGFGHEDAYANALAYRALKEMAKLAAAAGQADDQRRYAQAAEHLRKAYFEAFYDPSTGVLAGWRSADGQRHDYYFLWVNGIAIDYGLVPSDRAGAIMDRLLAKMNEVGYTRFDLGLPGNLIPVARKDYVDLNPRFGGGTKEDNSDGFQRYENGGATACYAYFTLAALYDLGRRAEADRMLFPMLGSFAKGGFEGACDNGMTKDWKSWDGACWGYEGFLVDNYYTFLAVLKRQGALK